MKEEEEEEVLFQKSFFKNRFEKDQINQAKSNRFNKLIIFRE
jgi:hypothetical protein